MIKRHLSSRFRLLSGMVLTAALCLLTSCSNEEVNGGQNDTEEGTLLSFVIKLDSDCAPIQTRSRVDEGETWAGPYNKEEATEWESSIRNLALYAFTTDGDYYGQLTKMIEVGGGIYKAYLRKADGEYATGEELDGLTLRLHIFLNTLPTVVPATESELFELTDPDWYKPGGGYVQSDMPMWGMKETTLAWQNDSHNLVDLGTFNVLRSVAKVEVVLTNTDDSYDYIDNITLKGLTAKKFSLVPGYLDSEPGDEYAVRRIKDTTELKLYNSVFKSEPDKNSNSVVINPLSGDNKRVIFYIPEQTNTSLSEVTMILKAGGETFSDFPIEFCDYNVNGEPDGMPKNIIRNHYYRFAVTIKKGHISIQATNWSALILNQFNF